MELLSPRLRLSEWRVYDFQDFSRLAKNPNVVRCIGDGKLWDDQRTRKFIERQQQLQKVLGHCLWVLELQEEKGLIGFCGIAPFEPPGFLEIGWWLDEICWGQGYATEAAKRVLSHATQELGINQLRSVSHQDHIRSQAIMRRIGMSHERDDLLGIFCKEPKDLTIRVYVYEHKPKTE